MGFLGPSLTDANCHSDQGKAKRPSLMGLDTIEINLVFLGFFGHPYDACILDASVLQDFSVDLKMFFD